MAGLSQLAWSMSCRPVAAMIGGLLQTRLVPATEPTACKPEDGDLCSGDWKAALERRLSAPQPTLPQALQFGGRSTSLVFARQTLLGRLAFGAGWAEVERELETVEFELFVAGSEGLSDAWRRSAIDWPRYSFADSHLAHRTLTAFRGTGHDRLVSRRWLDYGPWLTRRDEARDITYIYFHAEDATPEEALKQALPGQRRMGISLEGGFIQTGFYPWHHTWSGEYFHDDRILEVVATGRRVTAAEMQEACALRLFPHLGEDRPVSNVRYVFPLEEEARAHLHELWLHGLECWTYATSDGCLRRLDEDYDPGPPDEYKPDWVRDHARAR